MLDCRLRQWTKAAREARLRQARENLLLSLGNCCCQLARHGRQLQVQNTVIKAWDQNLHTAVWDQLATKIIHDVANCLDRKLARVGEVCCGRDNSAGQKGLVMNQQSLRVEVDLGRSLLTEHP